MYFTIRRSSSGQYWWRAVGNNNKVLAASELMHTKQHCYDAIATVQAGAASAPIYDKTDEVSLRRAV